MYKKSISILLISTLSLSVSLSSCSIGVSNTGKNISSVTSSPISSAQKIEQAGPLSLGESGFKSQQNIIIQEQVISLQKEVNFLQKQAVYLQEQANLLQEAASLTIRIENPDNSVSVEPNITMEQRKAEVARQQQEMAKLAGDKQNEATKAFDEVNAKQAEIWKLQEQINIIPQTGLKTQADAPADDTRIQLQEILRQINENMREINSLGEFSPQMMLRTAQLLRIRLDLYRQYEELQDSLCFKHENLLVSVQATNDETDQIKNKEIKRYIDETAKFQNDLSNQYNDLNSYDVTDLLTQQEKKINEQKSYIDQLQSWLDSVEKEKTALVNEKDRLKQALTNALAPIQDLIQQSENTIKDLTSKKDNSLKWLNLVGYRIYSGMLDKARVQYNSLLNQRSSVTSDNNYSTLGLSIRIAKKNNDIQSMKNTLNNAKTGLAKLQEIYDQTRNNLNLNNPETLKIIKQMLNEMNIANKKIQDEYDKYAKLQEEINKLEAEKTALRLDSSKKETERQADLAKKIKELEDQKQAAIKAAEADEKARLEIIMKAEAEKLNVEKQVIEEQENARKEKEIVQTDLNNKENLIINNNPNISTTDAPVVSSSSGPIVISSSSPTPVVSSSSGPIVISSSSPTPVVSSSSGPIVISSGPIIISSTSPTPGGGPIISSEIGGFIGGGGIVSSTQNITLLPELVNITQNNTASIRIFVKDSNGQYITDGSVKIESLNSSIVKINKIEKGSIEFIVELGFVNAGEGKIKVTTSTGVTKTISVFTSAASSSSPQLMVISVQGTTQIAWSNVAGAASYKLYIKRINNSAMVVDGTTQTSPYTPALCNALGMIPQTDGFRIAGTCDDTTIQKNLEYNVWVEAIKADGTTVIYTFQTVKILGLGP